LEKENHVHDFTDGINSIRELVKTYPPEMAAQHTGIPAEDIRQLTKDFAQAQSACCYGRLGTSVQEHGSLNQWLMICLNLMTGNMDREGGVMFPQPAIDFLKAVKKEAKALRWTSRVRQLPEVAGDLPAATMIDEINTPGPGQIKGLITIAGNPVLSSPNGTKLAQSLEQLDFVLAIDIYLNETTRHASLILPPATGIESFHYGIALHIVSMHNTAKYSEPGILISENQRFDWNILESLMHGIERKRGANWLTRTKHAVQRFLHPQRKIDLALRIGPYGQLNGRLFQKNGLNLKRLIRHPHGIDFGQLKTSLPGRLFTKNKRLKLDHDLFIDAVKAVSLKSDSIDFPLRLIGRRDLRSNNSWMHNSKRLQKGPNRCSLLMHPEEADARQLITGDLVEVISTVGKIRLPLEVSDSMMPGVVSIPHGWGHNKSGVRLRIASQKPGVSINDLTDHLQVDPISGTAVLTGIPVEVQAITKEIT
ncbi:MAG: molybdopterin oxidoreductase family protein, partial [Bacteroidota bacterium]